MIINRVMCRGRFKRWPVARANKGGPVSFTYDWPVRPVDISTLDLAKKKFLTSCGLKVCVMYDAVFSYSI